MKILWHSVAPWVGSGYGQQTATFAPRLRRLGHDVALSVYYGLQGSQLRWEDMPVYPAYETGFGNDVMVTHALDHFRAKGTGMTFREAAASGLIITLCDVWVLGAPLLPDMAVASWCPVDHLQLPGITRNWFESSGAVPLAMSRHGHRQLEAAGLKPVYVPHGIDTSVFRPGDRAEARERTGLPADAFIVAMVAANVGRDGSRKAFAEQITAFAELRRRHSDALLLLHTDIENRQGVNLNRYLRRGLPDDAWIATDQYAYRKGIPAETVADIYRAADVLTNCSWGEGFGIPIVEAQACGTPVVVTDATAMSELCGAGWAVGYEPLWHESQDAWACIPRIGEIAAAYEEAYQHAGKLHDQAVDFAQLYDADFVTDTYWAPALATLADGLKQRLADARKPRPPRADVKVAEADGLMWIVRGDDTEDAIGPAAGHEGELAPLLEALLPEGGYLIDIGAHVGHWSLRLAGRAAQVWAIEANPEAAGMLRRNLALNDIRNVAVVEVALWDSETTLQLEDPAEHVAGGSTRTLPVEFTAEEDRRDLGPGQIVPAYPLDELNLRTPAVDLVKIDVEGADLHVLLGMRATLAEFRPVVFLECHDYCGYYTRGELEATLAELGYGWWTAYSQKSCWSPTGTLDEPVDADYLICVPMNVDPTIADIAREAVARHGAAQRPDELAGAMQAIVDMEPSAEVIVEIGCDVGGTLYAWRRACRHAAIVGITLDDNGYPTGGSGGEIDDHGADVIFGDSHDPEIREELLAALDITEGDEHLPRLVDVLVLDGDHHVRGIWQDLNDYGPLVRPGGRILLHDIRSAGDPRVEVWRYWPELRRRYRTSEIVSPALPYGWGMIHVDPDGFVPPPDPESSDDR